MASKADHSTLTPATLAPATPAPQRALFGTDGMRGRANTHPMTPDMVLRLATAAAQLFRRGSGPHRVVIGKDTRLSGYMLEAAMQAGFTASGMDVLLLGPAPTPAVAMLTQSLRADLGVMISASHNPYEDNGVKLFGPSGAKIADADEAAIEALMAAPADYPAPAQMGRARRVPGAVERYLEFTKASLRDGERLTGLKVVVDCANGAAYRAAPSVLWELGADVVQLGVAPNGVNINAGVGSTHPDACRQAVLDHGADVGVTLDGDADRVLLIDEKGGLIDGDQILAVIAQGWAEAGRLRGGAVVTTVMSNLGLERWLADHGIAMTRTPVGDRHVAEAMLARGCNVGGEQSGHIILSDFGPTGDGVMAALQALTALRRAEAPASRALRRFTPAPQHLRSVPARSGAALLDHPSVRAAVAAAQAQLPAGRLLIRPSGTEPVIRVMAEGDDTTAVTRAVDMICDAIIDATPAI